MTEEPPQENQVIVAILIGLIIFLSIVLVWIAFPPLLDWVRRKMPVSKKRIARRYATIDGWLISKRVQPHDACCHLLITQLADDPTRYAKPCCTSGESTCDCAPAPTTCVCRKDGYLISNGTATTPPRKFTFSSQCMLKKLSSIHWEKKQDEEEGSDGETNEEDPEESLKEENEEEYSDSTDGDDYLEDVRDIMNKKCAICLEKFRVHEVVSWSCDPACQHVFHHECLRSWLLRRIRCPCCRAIVLPIDRPKNQIQSTKGRKRLFGKEKFSSEDLGEMASQRAKYLTRTYFCVENGLVILRNIEESRKKKAEAAAAEAAAASSKTLSSTTSNSNKDELEDEENQSKSTTATPTESKRNFRFWKRKQNENDDALNTTGSMCSDDSFGDVDSDDEKAATPCQLHRRNTSRTVRMGSGSISETFDDSASDLEAADSSFSETEQGFSSSSYRTTSDDEVDQSCRSELDINASCQSGAEDSHCLSCSCRTNEIANDGNNNSSSTSHDDLHIDQSGTNQHNGLEIVRLNV